MPQLVWRQPNAQARAQGRVLCIRQGIEAIPQRIHHFRGAVEGHVRQDHAEFIPAVAPGQVGGAQVLAQDFAQSA